MPEDPSSDTEFRAALHEVSNEEEGTYLQDTSSESRAPRYNETESEGDSRPTFATETRCDGQTDCEALRAAHCKEGAATEEGSGHRGSLGEHRPGGSNGDRGRVPKLEPSQGDSLRARMRTPGIYQRAKVRKTEGRLPTTTASTTRPA